MSVRTTSGGSASTAASSEGMSAQLATTSISPSPRSTCSIPSRTMKLSSARAIRRATQEILTADLAGGGRRGDRRGRAPSPRGVRARWRQPPARWEPCGDEHDGNRAGRPAAAGGRRGRAGPAGPRTRARSAQARWQPGPERVGPLEVLSEQDRTRVPELVPVRYGRMLASAFTFYRGAAAIMAADLAAGARLGPAGAALRRRPPLQLRRLPGTRPPPRLRRQRLRRDAARARSSGTSSDSRRASRSAPATAASAPPRARPRCSPAAAAYRDGDGRSSRR